MLSGLVFRLIKGTPLTSSEGDSNLRLIRDAINSLFQLFGVVLNPNGTLKPNAVGSTDVIADGVVTAAKLAADAKLPAGTVHMFAGGTVPTGYLLCDGSQVNRTTYATLFTAIGTAYGAGDGSTTFNLPDLRGRVPIGAGTGAGLTNRVLGASIGEEEHTITEDELPAHSHSLEFDTMNLDGGSNKTLWLESPSIATGNATLETEDTGSGDPINVIQPSLVINFIIKT